MRPQSAITVWTLDVRAVACPDDMPPAAWLDVLDDEERQRCQRLRRTADRLSYAAAHALTRHVLADALADGPGYPAEAITFTVDDNGKPHLASRTPITIGFSLSHTVGMAAVAIHFGGPVGIDVESDDRRLSVDGDFLAHALPAAQAARIADLPPGARNDAFLHAWTGCEAVAKADGRGLSLPFTAIAFDAAGTGATLPDTPPRRWQLRRCRPTSIHRLAVAWPELDGVRKAWPLAEPQHVLVHVTADDGYRLRIDTRTVGSLVA